MKNRGKGQKEGSWFTLLYKESKEDSYCTLNTQIISKMIRLNGKNQNNKVLDKNIKKYIFNLVMD